MSAARRRRCPRCGITLAAGRFPVLRFGRGWGQGTQARRCPSCGLKAASYRFVVVADERRITYAGMN